MIKINNSLPGYQVNSMGYRTAEFDSISWTDSYIIQGCSACFGVGIPDNDNTISARLSSKLQAPVINLGVSGGSVELQYFNTIEMIEDGIRPKGVFMMWPNPDRFPFFNDGILENCGAWSDPDKLSWALNNNSFHHNFYHHRAVKIFWQLANVPFVDFSHHPGTENGVDCHLSKFLDLGDDHSHWGPKTAEHVAEMLFQKC